MLYLNKLLSEIKKNSEIFKSQQIILNLGIAPTHIKNLKKYAIENQFILQDTKEKYLLTSKGEEYLKLNPIKNLKIIDLQKPLNINVEYLKEEKTPSILTKSIRLLAKNLLLREPLKESSIENALLIELKNIENLVLKIEKDLIKNEKINLEKFYEKNIKKGYTKSLLSIILLKILTKNINKIAIYEKLQFQLDFNYLMFDRIMACPQNFEIQKTEMTYIPIFEDISQIILNEKNNNILNITKGLYKIIKSLDKYTMQTQNLNKKTIRLRNVIVNAKDPISLFEREIPKVFSFENIQVCENNFLIDLTFSLNELKNCTKNLTVNLNKILLNTFNVKTKKELINKFIRIKEYLNNQELIILYKNICETNITDELWINRIATFINKSRVPKDWNDEDYTNFKIRIKELALKIYSIEASIGIKISINKKTEKILNNILKLTKEEQLILLREIANY